MTGVEHVSSVSVLRPEPLGLQQRHGMEVPPNEAPSNVAGPRRPPVTDRVALTPGEELKRDQKLVEEELERLARRKKERNAVLTALLDPAKPTLPTESMGKCVTIAGRIMRGESVTPVEEEYLSGNAPQLYQQAVLMRQQGEDDEGHTDILSQEDLLHGEAATTMQALRPDLRRLFSMLSEEDMAGAFAGTEDAGAPRASQ